MDWFKTEFLTKAMGEAQFPNIRLQKVLLIVILIGGAGALIQEALSQSSSVATVEIVGDVDLSKGGTIRGVVSRVVAEDAQSAVGKFLEGEMKVSGSAGNVSIQVQWSALKSSPGGSETSPTPGLVSTFKPGKGNRLASGSRLVVAGESAALIRAAGQIGDSAVPPQSAEGEEAEKEGEPTGRDSAGIESGTVGGGNESKSNELADPPAISVAPTPKTVETIVNNDVFGVTTEGCEPLLDVDRNVVVVLEASTKNGVKTSECAPGLTELPVKKSFAGCLYDTDLDAKKAFAMSRRYFTSGTATTFLDENCVRDAELEFQITESAVGCPLVPSLATLKAAQHTKLTFLGRQNEPVETAACAVREGDVFTISFDEDSCGFRDDFEGSKTFRQHRAVYTDKDGLVKPVTECQDTPEFFAHIKDTTVCEPFPDFTGNKLFPQFRIRIAISGADAFRTPSCQPDTTAIADLVATPEGCEAFHEDFDGFSLGGKRIVRSDNNEQVRACQAADIQFPHQREAQGFLYDDAGLTATPKEALFIELPQPAGKTFIEQAVVRTDAIPVAYILKSTFIRNDSVDYVDGACEKFQNRSNIKVWTRPDATEFEQVADPASALGPLPACAAPVSVLTSQGPGGQCQCGNGFTQNFRTTALREDGVSIFIGTHSSVSCTPCPTGGDAGE